MKFAKTFFAAFCSRNYKLFTAGQVVSNLGYLIEHIALTWLVYRITNSAFQVGILFFIMQITIFFTSPFSGVLSDRFPRYKILLVTNVILACVSFILGVLVVFNYFSLIVILLLQIVAGLARGIDNPIRNTYVNDLIDKPEHLINAITINSSMFNLAKVVGPVIAALLIPWIGEGICFIINGFSFLFLIYIISCLDHKPQSVPVFNSNVFADIREGFQYAFSFSPLRTTILFIAFIGLMSFSLNVTIPVYAKLILEGGADTFGFITTFSGIGALMAALYLSQKKNALGLDRTIFIAGFIFNIGFLLFAYVENFLLASLLMLIIGFGQLLIFASASSILQTLSEKNKLGRVIGLYFMVFMACTTVGSIVMGKLTDILGPAFLIKIVSILSIMGTFFYGLQISKIRRKGIRRFIHLGIDSVTLRNKYYNQKFNLKPIFKY